MTYITREAQPVYLRSLDYNICRVFEELAKNIEGAGGRVKPALYITHAHNRDAEGAPVVAARYRDYIRFELDGLVYYFQTDDNPFFPFYYNKTRNQNGKYSRDAGLEELAKDWLVDPLWEPSCPEAVIQYAAQTIFDALQNAPISQIIRSTQKKRVPNVYSDGWHWENVPEPERFAPVDW